MSLAIEGGNFHTVKVGEHWRVQAVRSPYMCPLLECDGKQLNPPGQMFMVVDPAHLVDGRLNDDCCYFDVEIMKVTDQFIWCKTLPESDEDCIVFEVLNSDAIVRFYRKGSVSN